MITRTFPTSTRLWLAAVVMSAAVLGAGPLFEQPAWAADPVITGTVLDSADFTQPDVAVDVFPQGSTNPVKSTTTNADGFFSVTVTPGIYDLRFTPPENTGLRTYLATGVNTASSTPLTVILRPIIVVQLDGVVRDSQGGIFTGGQITFQPSSGPANSRPINTNGQYSTELLSGQYRVSAFAYRNGIMFNANLNTPIEFDQNQTYNFTFPTKTLSVAVRNIDGSPVTNASLRYENTNVSTPTYNGFNYSSQIHVDTNGNLATPIITGTNLQNPTIVLDTGLVIPLTIPTMDTDRRIYMIFDRVTGQYFIDDRAPIVGGVLDRTPNAYGWHNAPLTVTWTAADPAPSSGPPNVPPPTTISAEGANQTVTSEPACDPAGNCATGQATVSIDRTAPEITYEVTPAANAQGWHKQSAVVTFTCTDALSGIASCPAPVTVDADGAGQVVSGTATDKAGNTKAVNATVNLDRVAPTISAAVSQAPTGGWNNGDVTVAFACADALSGVQQCSGPVTLTEDGPDQVVTGTVVDKAGNSTEVTVTVSIDKSKPLITAVRTPANGAGWNNGPVTVTFTCSDAQSGITTCPSPVTVGTEGAGLTVEGTAVNGAGATATAVVDDINIDTTAPAITATVLGDKNAAGWYRTPPTVHFTCSDALSGVAVCPADLTLTGDGADQSAGGTVVDRAGNTAAVSVTDLDIDVSPPAVTVAGVVAGTTYPLNQPPAISCTTSDAVSGVATPATLSIGRDAAGVHTATCSGAADVAGNPAPPRSVSYTVAPTATSLGVLTGQYVQGSGQPNANGVTQSLQNKLLHGLICQYIDKVTMEAAGTSPTLTAAQAAELIYWARLMDPSC